jgi:hypothetical protein
MAVDNYTILHDVWLKGTNDYQQRIPEPTQTNIDQTVGALFDPMNQNYFNQFMDALIMRIGTTYVHQQSFRNPLREFKKPNMIYGSTIQEMIPKWMKKQPDYQPDNERIRKNSNRLKQLLGEEDYQPTPERIKKNNEWLDSFLAEQERQAELTARAEALKESLQGGNAK